MKETLLAFLVSIGNPIDTVRNDMASQIDLTYAPCRELYAAALTSKKMEDMRHVLHVCKPIAAMRTDE